jgi:hypothetical protein
MHCNEHPDHELSLGVVGCRETNLEWLQLVQFTQRREISSLRNSMLSNCVFSTDRTSATKISSPLATSAKPATRRAVPNGTNRGASRTTELPNYCRDFRQVALGPSRTSPRRYQPMCQSSK